MQPVDPVVVAGLFAPERPGPLLHAHIVASGVGSCRADRPTAPRTAVAELPGGNVALRGEPVALPGLTGLVEAPAAWLPALREVDPHTGVWDRLVAVLPPAVDLPAAPAGVRPLTATDTSALEPLDASIAWIGETWGGAAGLARSGYAVAAVEGGRVLSVACSFFVGRGYEDIGVVTEPAARGRGLSTACAALLAAHVRRRGKQPSWTTSPGNAASRAVAARLGFVLDREDVLWAVGMPVPPDG